MADDAPATAHAPDVKPNVGAARDRSPAQRPPTTGSGATTTSYTTPPTDSSAEPSLADGSPSNTMQIDGHGGAGSVSGGEAGPSAGGGGGATEDVLALRRREANRLAAQRFRSRKKGYQDSLEERIRALEEEKDSLSRRLERAEDDGAGGGGGGGGRFGRASRRSPSSDPYPRSSMLSSRFGGTGGRSTSPVARSEAYADIELRVAGLESANRRLQDELRGVYDENDRLRAELERWREWTRESRAANVAREPRDRDRDRDRDRERDARDVQYHDEYHHREMASRSTYRPTSPFVPPPALPPAERVPPFPQNPPPPPIAYRAGSPGIQLAPLRLPPLAGSSPSARTTLPSPQLAPPALTYPPAPVYATDRPRSAHGQQALPRPGGR
ncbi:hypothetical protein Q5752_004650 [Cryptotrichosporon argae]